MEKPPEQKDIFRDSVNFAELVNSGKTKRYVLIRLLVPHHTKRSPCRNAGALLFLGFEIQEA
ncbi:hypothetical protein [Pseudomonas prosekii]|uniref:hypothetical protein n=1 Tax=Pseudomonas prosekii TaxID=1148509 RepID=UPI003F755922